MIKWLKLKYFEFKIKKIKGFKSANLIEQERLIKHYVMIDLLDNHKKELEYIVKKLNEKISKLNKILYKTNEGKELLDQFNKVNKK